MGIPVVSNDFHLCEITFYYMLCLLCLGIRLPACLPKFLHNMLSVLEQHQVVQGYLAKECSKGRVLGPLNPTAFPQVHAS